jgi:hypothetical protein
MTESVAAGYRADPPEEKGTAMTQDNARGAAEELSGVPETPEEHNAPASPSSLPGGDSTVRGASEELSDSPRTEPDA